MAYLILFFFVSFQLLRSAEKFYIPNCRILLFGNGIVNSCNPTIKEAVDSTCKKNGKPVGGKGLVSEEHPSAKAILAIALFIWKKIDNRFI